MEMDASKYYKISDIYFYKTISTILSTQTIYLLAWTQVVKVSQDYHSEQGKDNILLSCYKVHR